jgi:tetratricopeptide (TPR) repeat protein
MKPTRTIFTIALLLIASVLEAQQGKLDSLRQLIQPGREDSVTAYLYDKMFNAAIGTLPDSALVYAKKMAAMGEVIRNEHVKSLGNNHVAQVYFMKENRPQALNYLLLSLASYEKLHDSVSAARCYNNIGVLYLHLDQYDNALKYYEKSLAIQLAKSDTLGYAQSYGNMGIAYMSKKDYDKALSLCLRSLSIKQHMKKKHNVSNELVNIGNIYYYKEKYDSAFYYNQQAYTIRLELKDTLGLGTACNNLGTIYRKLGKPEESIQFQLLSVLFSKRSGNLEALKNAYMGLAEVYEDKKDYHQAFDYYKLSSSIKDSLLNESTNKSIAEMQTRFDTEKKEKENELLKKEAELKDDQLAAQETEKKYFYGVGALILALALALLIAFRTKQRANILLSAQKAQIEEQKKEIVDSIHYARRIQQSQLPTDLYLERNIKRLKRKD